MTGKCDKETESMAKGQKSPGPFRPKPHRSVFRTKGTELFHISYL